mmetsp:Transcript_24081/g.27783  ORF Transcript_24081/g.27783 Transcript_24081/m.27783 type:complete len:107 (+) Transcript_24081:7-327(+)
MADLIAYTPSAKAGAAADEQDDDFDEPRNFAGALSENNEGTEGDQNQDTYIIEFLSDYEENLPEYFDAKKVKKENASNCKLCSKKFAIFAKKHSCRRCGAAVCDQC